MAVWLANFADRAFRKSQKRLAASAKPHGIDRVVTYAMRDLKRDPFYHQHLDLFAYKLRIGNCLWKPLFIKRTLEKMSDGDTLLYCDARVAIVSSVKPLVRLAEQKGGIVPFVVHELKIGNWTKRDCLILLGCDSPEYYDLEQANAAFMVFRKCPAAVAFVDEWLAACSDARTLTDDPNVMGKDDLPLFVAHRHDQAVLALLLRKKKIEHFRDPSQFGNDYLTPRAGQDESTWPWRNSTYPMIFDHHRQRAIPWSKFTGAVLRRLSNIVRTRQRVRRMFPARSLKPIIQTNRKILASVPQWMDDSTFKNSIVGYGLSAADRPSVDLPIAPDLTYSDALVHLSTYLTKPVSYLELGVGVGKNFAQMLHSFKNASLTGRDIEDINPILEKMLIRQSVTEIPDPAPSLRGGPIRVTDFLFPAGNNTVRYVAGDGMHELAWQPLVGKKHNVIFSDLRRALHRQLFFHLMIKELDLVDGDEFIMAWEDLGGLMEIAFRGIAADLQRRYGNVLVTTLPLRGMLGSQRHHRKIGFVMKLPGYSKTLPPWVMA